MIPGVGVQGGYGDNRIATRRCCLFRATHDVSKKQLAKIEKFSIAICYQWNANGRRMIPSCNFILNFLTELHTLPESIKFNADNKYPGRKINNNDPYWGCVLTIRTSHQDKCLYVSRWTYNGSVQSLYSYTKMPGIYYQLISNSLHQSSECYAAETCCCLSSRHKKLFYLSKLISSEYAWPQNIFLALNNFQPFLFLNDRYESNNIFLS